MFLQFFFSKSFRCLYLKYSVYIDISKYHETYKIFFKSTCIKNYFVILKNKNLQRDYFYLNILPYVFSKCCIIIFPRSWMDFLRNFLHVKKWCILLHSYIVVWEYCEFPIRDMKYMTHHSIKILVYKQTIWS